MLFVGIMVCVIGLVVISGFHSTSLDFAFSFKYFVLFLIKIFRLFNPLYNYSSR